MVVKLQISALGEFIMDNRSIEILKSSFLLMPSPCEESFMYGMYVTPVLKKEEVHFVLQSTDSEEEIMVKGYESPVCIQILSSFRELILGKYVNDIHFYVYYDKEWKELTFHEFYPELIKTQWPNSDSGEAIGVPKVKRITKARWQKKLTDDYNSDPLVYWWRSDQINERMQEIVQEKYYKKLKPTKRTLPFGDLEYEVTEYKDIKSIFAVSKEVLKIKIEQIKKNNKVVFLTPVKEFVRLNKSEGWSCGAIVVSQTESEMQLIEPGEYERNEETIHEWTKKITLSGGIIETLQDGRIKAILPTEVDFSELIDNKYRVSCVMAKRGEYIFSKEKVPVWPAYIFSKKTQKQYRLTPLSISHSNGHLAKSKYKRTFFNKT